MAWVRIDDQVTDHPKHLKAGPAASWLWVCGLAYCQRRLTDGFIPENALTLLGVPKDTKKLAAQLVAVGLFDRVDGGYSVHDYLDYNSSREAVLQQRSAQHDAKVKAGREGSRARWQNDSSGLAEAKQGDSSLLPTLLVSQNSPIPSHSPPNPQKELLQGSGEGVQPPDNALVSEEIADRAGRFLEHYPELYRLHRNGAHYIVKPVRDYPPACQLVKGWSDERLDKMAELFLRVDLPQLRGKTRTVGEFLYLAPWCDSELRKHGQ